MVFDRGMVSSENLQSLEGEKWSYVSAMDRDEIAISDFFLKENHVNLSPEEALEVLGGCQLNSVGANGTSQGVLKITGLDYEQRQPIKALECEYIGEAKWYKKVLKKAENLI